MAISRVPGFSLLANLDRQGTDLYISSNGQTLTYFDVNNYRFGINNPSPQYELDILGNVQIGSGHLYTSANVSFDIGTSTNWWRNIYVNSVTTSSLSMSGNLSAAYISGTLTTSAQPYITSVGNLNSLTVGGNITAGNVNTTYLTGTILTGNQPYITNLGNIIVSNITVIGGEFDFGGDASFGNLHADSLFQNDNPVLDSTSTINITGDATGSGNVSNVSITLVNSGVTTGTYGSATQIPVLGIDSTGRVITASNVAGVTTGNISFSNVTMSSTTELTISTVGNGNIYLNASGNGIVQIQGTDAFSIPAGTTAQRPTTVNAGYIRFNTDTGGLEVYDGTNWDDTTATITSQTLNGNGIANTFTLSSTVVSENDLIVSINGTLQQPAVAYSVNGTNITFTEVPVSGDVIEVRHISKGAVSVDSLALGSSNIKIPSVNGPINISTNGNYALQIGTTGAIIGTYPNIIIASSGVATNVDVFSSTVYRTAKYIFQANTSSAYESSEVLVTHDGSTAYRTVYAVITTAGSLGNVSATINGTDVLVQYTADNNNTNIRTLKQYLII